MTVRLGSLIAAALALAPGAALADPAFAPDPILPSDLQLRVTEYDNVPTPSSPNFASPVSAGGALWVVDQTGAIYRENPGGGFTSVLPTVPSGLTLDPRSGVLNISEGRDASELFVAFTSTTLPDGIPNSTMPAGIGQTGFQVIYKFDVGSELSNPEPIHAFAYRGGHVGGGMLTLPDGTIAFATGDNRNFDSDGTDLPQLDDNHLSKIMLVDPDTGLASVGAKGVRNVQRLAWADEARTQIAFADLGADTAEEINQIAVADLNGAGIENFGWGRNADGNAREGMFYIDAPSGPSDQPEAIALAPSPEAGFLQPHAQWGLDPSDSGFVAATGPVLSSASFTLIEALFGDLPTGEVYATTDPLTGTDVSVFDVGLVDGSGNPTSLFALAGDTRPDPRFFSFPDGSAGVMLEANGTLYSLSEVPAAVPGPASLWLLAGALGLGAAVRRRASSRPSRS